MKKITLLGMAFLISFGLLGVGYANWSSALTISGNMTSVVPTTLHLNPSSATDLTGTSHNLTSTELGYLTSNDSNKYTVGNNWPRSAPDNSIYVEFRFSPNLNSLSTVDSVSLTFVWFGQSKIDTAKLRISSDNGTTWTEYTIGTIPSSDSTITLDLKNSYGVNTYSKVNNLMIRFEAGASSSGSNTRTVHNQVQVDVTYR